MREFFTSCYSCFVEGRFYYEDVEEEDYEPKKKHKSSTNSNLKEKVCESTVYWLMLSKKFYINRLNMEIVTKTDLESAFKQRVSDVSLDKE